MHHRSFFLSQEAFQPNKDTHVYAIETKDFIPPGHVDWFKNQIPTPDTFEEGKMANISPTIKIDISIKPGIVEEITLGVACSPKEVTTYKDLFQEFRIYFPGHIQKFLGSIQPLLNIESIHGLMFPIHQNK
jgi:hypothetical protein